MLDGSTSDGTDRRGFLKVAGSSGVVGVGSMLAGCADSGTGGGDTSTAGTQQQVTSSLPDEGQTGGKLTVAMQSDVEESLHPHKIPDTTATTMVENFGNSLVMMTPEGKVEPDLAREMPKVSDNGKTYTFKLRKGVKFHPPYDSEVTADDVVENWRKILSKDYGAYGRSTYEGILVGENTSPEQSVKKTGKYEVTFNLAQPFAPFLVKQAKMSAFGWFTIVPMKALEEHGKNFGATNTGVWGTGPFVYKPKKSKQGSSYVFEKNPDYFKETDAGQLPFLDQITYEIAPEANTRTTALKAGDIDIDESTAATDIKSLKNTNGVTVVSKPSTSKMSQWVNTRNFAPLSKAKVRKALLHAANRKAVVETKFRGFGEVAHSPLPPWHWAYDEESCVKYDHDPEKAKQLLQEAGHGNGFSFKCEPTNQPKFVDVAKILQQNYKKVGVDMTIKPASKGTTWNPLVGGWDDKSVPPAKWHSMIENFTWGFSADDFTFATFHSQQPFNYSYYSNEKADEAMEKARKAQSREARKKQYKTVQKLLTRDQPQPFLVWTNVSHGFRNRVQNFQVYPSAYMLFEDVWLKQQ